MMIHSQHYVEVMVKTNYIFRDVKKVIKKIRYGRISIMYCIQMAFVKNEKRDWIPCSKNDYTKYTKQFYTCHTIIKHLRKHGKCVWTYSMCRWAFWSPHPPYTPDLSSSYHLFISLKYFLEWKHFINYKVMLSFALQWNLKNFPRYLANQQFAKQIGYYR